jgi:hypothetical protein
LDRYIKREYKAKGKSPKYIQLKESYDQKMKRAAEDHLQKYVRDMKEEAPGKAYRAMRKMGARPGDCDDDGAFTLTSHVESNLSPQQSVDKMADYFSEISQKHEPLDIATLPDRVRSKIEAQVNYSEIPTIEEYQIWENMKSSKKTKSCVPGELPARLRHEFGPELAGPAATIFNNIARSGCWVEHWKHESAIALKKTDNPTDEADTRVISITHYLSLQMEKFVLVWLLKHIQDKLDRDQFGGAKKHSVAHYLIEIMNFVLYNQDLPEKYATLMAAIDISKGFNKMEHEIVLTKLSDMGTPGWLLKIIASYLSGRTLSIRYRGATSTARAMPGGAGAGTILGLELFLVLFNGAGPEASSTSIGQQITQPKNLRQPIKTSKVKWVDDITICAAVELESALVPEDRAVPRPVPYHARTGHRLPPDRNPLQHELDKLREYTDSHKMAINHKKSRAMILNKRRKWDVMPELSVQSEDNIEIVEELKIVGFMLRSDLKTSSNTRFITKKAYARMWILRRLKALGANSTELLDVMEKQVLSALWLGVPAWYGMTTQKEKVKIDRVMRCCLRIIYGDNYGSFEQALARAKATRPTVRMQKMTNKFAAKCSRDPKFSKWFKRAPSKNIKTRSKSNPFLTVPARTQAFEESPIPQFTTMLNAKHQ